MLKIPFSKYQGTGNDFILVDQTIETYISPNNHDLIAALCDRRFGIGADGLILCSKSTISDFKMVYFNADGNQSTMCGNGGRCIVQFARHIGLIENDCVFEAVDGIHHANILSGKTDIVRLKMNDVHTIKRFNANTFELNTGSPHYVCFCDYIPDDIDTAGRKIRYSDAYKKEGINVNFVALTSDGIKVATYERGVEGETLSCGTGVTAAAIAAGCLQNPIKPPLKVITKGGELTVDYTFVNNAFVDVWLTGPAIKVFDGVIITDKLLHSHR